jgi:hypothetical protein
MHARGRLLLLRSPLLLRPATANTSSRKRGLSSSSGGGSAGSEDAYLETWQKQRIRPAAFYEAEGKARRWMYTVDLQGRLFLEEMRKKDLTSCLKNDKVSLIKAISELSLECSLDRAGRASSMSQSQISAAAHPPPD